MHFVSLIKYTQMTMCEMTIDIEIGTNCKDRFFILFGFIYFNLFFVAI